MNYSKYFFICFLDFKKRDLNFEGKNYYFNLTANLVVFWGALQIRGKKWE